MAPAREALRRIDPGVAVFNVQPLGDLVDAQLSAARFLSWITGAFAALALSLSVLGISGTLSYWVKRRTAEIGIRTALGASRSRVLTLVVGQAMMLAAIGVIVGSALALALGRVIASQLYAVEPIDWLSFAGTMALMLAAALMASLAPAVRALRVDPLAALRS